MEVGTTRNGSPLGRSAGKSRRRLLWIYGGGCLWLVSSWVWDPFLAGCGGFESIRFWLLSLSGIFWLTSIGVVVTMGAKAVYVMIRYRALSRLNTTGHIGAFAIAVSVIVVWACLWVFPIRPHIEKRGAQYRLNWAGGSQARKSLAEAAKQIIRGPDRSMDDLPEIFRRLGGRGLEVQNDAQGDPEPFVIVHTSYRPLRGDWYIYANPVPKGYRTFPYGIIEVEPGVYRWSE